MKFYNNMIIFQKNMTVRKTKKYFQEEIKASMKRAFDVLSEICKRYGDKVKLSPRKSSYTIYTENKVTGWEGDTTWRITGFYLSSNKKISVMVYWQGDSTDGDEYIEFKGDLYHNISLPPSEPINLGDRWCIDRDGIVITPQNIYEAIKGIKL